MTSRNVERGPRPQSDTKRGSVSRTEDLRNPATSAATSRDAWLARLENEQQHHQARQQDPQGHQPSKPEVGHQGLPKSGAVKLMAPSSWFLT